MSHCVNNVSVMYPYHHRDAIFLKRCFVISDVTDSNHSCGTKPLQVLKGTSVVQEKNLYLSKIKLWQVVMVATHLFTSMKELSVLSVGLWVMRNLMFLWHSSTGAGRFMVTSVTFDLPGWFVTCMCEQVVVNYKPSVMEKAYIGLQCT